MKRKLLQIAIYCDDCKIECEPTEEGILCTRCGGYVSDEELNEMAD